MLLFTWDDMFIHFFLIPGAAVTKHDKLRKFPWQQGPFTDPELRGQDDVQQLPHRVQKNTCSKRPTLQLAGNLGCAQAWRKPHPDSSLTLPQSPSLG